MVACQTSDLDSTDADSISSIAAANFYNGTATFKGVGQRVPNENVESNPLYTLEGSPHNEQQEASDNKDVSTQSCSTASTRQRSLYSSTTQTENGEALIPVNVKVEQSDSNGYDSRMQQLTSELESERMLTALLRQENESLKSDCDKRLVSEIQSRHYLVDLMTTENLKLKAELKAAHSETEKYYEIVQVVEEKLHAEHEDIMRKTMDMYECHIERLRQELSEVHDYYSANKTPVQENLILTAPRRLGSAIGNYVAASKGRNASRSARGRGRGRGRGRAKAATPTHGVRSSARVKKIFEEKSSNVLGTDSGTEVSDITAPLTEK